MTRQQILSLLMEELVKEKPDRARLQDWGRQLGLDARMDVVQMMAYVLEQASQKKPAPRPGKDGAERNA